LEQVVGIDVPLGYRMVDKTKKMKIWEAEEILTTRRQKYYTRAERNGIEAELVSSYIVCPCCGREFVSNTKYSTCGCHWYNNSVHVSYDKVREWGSLQQSFFEVLTKKVIHFSSPIKEIPSFKCPECNNISNPSDQIRHVVVSLKNNIIELKSTVIDIRELMILKWVGDEDVTVVYPMYEILTFDTERGKVYVRLENFNGEVACKRDVTAHPELLEGSTVANMIINNKKVYRTLKRMFKSVWGCDLPYAGDNITVKNLFEMTRFVGYPQEFFRCIPYKRNTLEVESSFREITEKMQNSKEAVVLYEKSKLPKVKSVRKNFFENPALFFYLPEAETLWTIIGDPNVYCTLVRSSKVFRLLSDIHMYPGITEFIEHLCKRKSAVWFVKYALYGWREIVQVAIKYSCANKNLRAELLRDLTKKKTTIETFCGRPPFLVPMSKPDDRIVDCSIDGYDFCWLRTSSDYDIAGEQLGNCLTSWQIDNNPVICVKRSNKYIAAIEINDKKIIQARLYDNMPIEMDLQLFDAFDKWKEKYRLEWTEELDAGFDDDDDLDPGF